MKENKKLSGKISDQIKKNVLLMGILNVTPDSFSDGGKYFKLEDALNHAESLLNRGFHIIDIGGESTRPNASLIPEDEEIKRVIPIIEKIKNKFKSKFSFQISIDTYKSNVAKRALEAGASIINDVSGLTMDKKMLDVALEFNCPLVIMHNTGIPAEKPKRKLNKNIVDEIYLWLKKQSDLAIKKGIKKENIIIDPGIGFGKTAEEDFYIIENLNKLKDLNYVILIGASKKSFIKKIYGEKINIDKKIIELNNLCIKNGANILRLH